MVSSYSHKSLQIDVGVEIVFFFLFTSNSNESSDEQLSCVLVTSVTSCAQPNSIIKCTSGSLQLRLYPKRNWHNSRDENVIPLTDSTVSVEGFLRCAKIRLKPFVREKLKWICR